MRTALEIINSHKITGETSYMVKVIEDIQKEAWNEAVDACAESAKAKIIKTKFEHSQDTWSTACVVIKESILKLKK